MDEQNNAQNIVIAGKADQTYVDEQNNAQNVVIAGKANQSYVDAADQNLQTQVDQKLEKSEFIADVAHHLLLAVALCLINAKCQFQQLMSYSKNRCHKLIFDTLLDAFTSATTNAVLTDVKPKFMTPRIFEVISVTDTSPSNNPFALRESAFDISFLMIMKYFI